MLVILKTSFSKSVIIKFFLRLPSGALVLPSPYLQHRPPPSPQSTARKAPRLFLA